MDGLLCLFLLSPFIVKIPLYGLHLWLPKAHVEAPTIGSVVLASVLLKLGVAGIIRVRPVISTNVLLVLSRLAILGGVVASLLVVGATDLKVLIALSSVFHMAVRVAGVCHGTHLSVLCVFLMFMGHGFVSALLFYIAFLVYTGPGRRSVLLIQGLLRLDPGLCLL